MKKTKKIEKNDGSTLQMNPRISIASESDRPDELKNDGSTLQMNSRISIGSESDDHPAWLIEQIEKICEMMNEIDGRPVRQDLQGATLTLSSKDGMEILERLKVLERGISHPQRKKMLSGVDALEGSSPCSS